VGIPVERHRTHQNAVTIDGTVTWTPTDAGFEIAQLYFLIHDHIGRDEVRATLSEGMPGGSFALVSWAVLRT